MTTQAKTIWIKFYYSHCDNQWKSQTAVSVRSEKVPCGNRGYDTVHYTEDGRHFSQVGWEKYDDRNPYHIAALNTK